MNPDRGDSTEPAVLLPSAGGDDSAAEADAGDILTLVGETIYDWSLADDTIRWGANASAVLRVGRIEEIATGRAYNRLLDPDNLSSRADAVLNCAHPDDGSGIAYQVQYALLPLGASAGVKLWIEDTGRWYADASGRPARARGVVRVVNERYQRDQQLAFLSRYDELTGFFNRSHLLTTLGDAIVNAKRLREPLAFLLVTVDNFRAINAAYGYDIADQVFATVARRIKAVLRDGDAIGRYSGNKLGLVLMNATMKNCIISPSAFRGSHATKSSTHMAGRLR